MKPRNHIFFAIFLIAGLMVASCGKSKEEQVREFALDFAEKASKNQIDSLKSVYPGIEKADSVALKYIAEGIVIRPSEDGQLYEVVLNPDVTIFVKPMEDGSFAVNESRGLFAYEEKQIKLLKDSKEWDSTLTDVQVANLLKGTVEKRLAFTSPDLDLFNLHGPVKEVAVSYTGLRDGEISLFEHPDDSKVYRFTEAGEWRHNFYQVKRNSNGYITKIYTDRDAYNNPDENHWFVGEFRWKGNTLKGFGLYPVETEFSYKDGKLSEIDTGWVQSMIMSDKIKFSDFKYDENGNWISCNWKEKVIIDANDSIPETKTYSGTMRRRIEYY